MNRSTMVVCRCAQVVLLHVASLGNLASAVESELIQAMDDHVKRLHTPEVRRLAEAARGVLKKSSDSHAMELERAILLFYDLRAKGVLRAVLSSDDPGLRLNGGYVVAKHCLDLFGPEDLLTLCNSAASDVSLRMDRQGEPIAEALARRTSEILGLEHTPIGPVIMLVEVKGAETIEERDIITPENVRQWWLKTLRRAKERGACAPYVGAALEFLEKQQESLPAAKKQPGKAGQ